MTRYAANTLTREDVQDYFAYLNPIATKIAFDINCMKSNYGHIWFTLNSNEQNTIINETLIKPEISLRYFDNFSSPSLSASTSSSTSSLLSGNTSQSASADSLAAVVLKNISVSRLKSPIKGTTKEQPSKKQEQERLENVHKRLEIDKKCYKNTR